MKNILLIIDYLHEIGGAERQLLYFLEGIDKDKYNVILCCLSGGELYKTIKRNNYEIYNLNVYKIYNFDGIKKLGFVLKLIRKYDVKLILTYLESSDIYGLIAAKISKIPIISSRRDMGFKLTAKNLWAYKLLGRFFNKIIAVSDAVRDLTIKRDNISPDKIITIGNGVDLKKIARSFDNLIQLKEELGIKENDVVIGIIAGLRPIKGHRLFIDAAAKIGKTYKNLKFLIIGNDFGEQGCSIKELNDYGKELKVDEKLIFTNKRTDIPELLSIIDIVVNTSFSEGMSNTILESMAAGKMVVASNVGGNPQLIINNESGLLFQSGDSDELYNKLVLCLESEELRTSVGNKAQKFVKDNYSLSGMCNKYMSVISELIK